MQTAVEKDKRTAILEAALGLIAEHGFHGAPIAAIAKQSGVSAGIIYHYFENKDDLITALYWHIKGRLSAALMADDVLSLPWPEHFDRMWLNAFDFYVQHPAETLFLEQFENSPYQDHSPQAEMDEATQALYNLIAEDIAQGLLKPLPYGVLYALTFGVAVSLAKQHISGALHLERAALQALAQTCRLAITASTQEKTK